MTRVVEVIERTARPLQAVAVETWTQRPGRTVGHCGPGIQPVIGWTLVASGAEGQRLLDLAVTRLRELAASCGEGHFVSIWLPHYDDDAVLLPLPHGAGPMAIAAMSAQAALQSSSARLGPEGLWLHGLQPQFVQAFLRGSGLERLLTGHRAAIRVMARQGEVAEGDRVGHARISWAQAGHDLQCLARSAGQWSASLVAAAATESWGVMVYGSETVAYDPVTDRFAAMVLLSVNANGRLAMEAAIGAGHGVTVRGAPVPLIAYTYNRDLPATLPSNRTAELLHTAVGDAALRLPRRGSTFELIGRLQPADTAGAPTHQDDRYVPFPAGCPEFVREVPEAMDCRQYRHPFSGARLILWSLRTDIDPALGDDLSPQMLGPDASHLWETVSRMPSNVDPLWEGQGDQRAGARTWWEGAADAGELLAGSVAAGGSIRIAGPGEVMETVVAMPVWFAILTPADMAVRAARQCCVESMQVRVEGAMGGLWARRRPPATSAGPRYVPLAESERAVEGGAAPSRTWPHRESTLRASLRWAASRTAPMGLPLPAQWRRLAPRRWMRPDPWQTQQQQRRRPPSRLYSSPAPVSDGTAPTSCVGSGSASSRVVAMGRQVPPMQHTSLPGHVPPAPQP